MKLLKKTLTLLGILMLLIVVKDYKEIFAAKKVARPRISVALTSDEENIKITISKTNGAEGYCIYMRNTSEEGFRELATIKKDGTKERTYTLKIKYNGDYFFRVKAYAKSGKKTVWSKYSESAKVESNKKFTHKLSKNISSANVGDIVVFGAYEQDNHVSNGKEPIEWIVLSKDDTEMLLLSRNVLDSKQFNEGLLFIEELNDWKYSSLRKWLNNEFYYKAFDGDERKAIKENEIVTEGDKTRDRVFLLSFDDVTNPEYGFRIDKGADVNRSCRATDYAIAQGCSVSNIRFTGEEDFEDKPYDDFLKSTWWRLRSYGPQYDYAIDVGDNGYISYHDMSDYETYSEGSFSRDDIGIRPAIYIEYKAR